MNVEASSSLYLDLSPDTESMLESVREGLSSEQKTLPSKYFYDARGSQLFDKICELEEYYPTRTELSILTRNLSAIRDHMGESIILIEYGSGSSTKTRLLLENIPAIKAYVPIDISREHLLTAAEAIAREYDHFDVLPVCGDYSHAIHLDLDERYEAKACVFFPGSTLGNFSREHAIAFLKRVRDMVGDEGGMLIGLDLVKDASVLHAAYNDAKGLTAQFNLNILRHLNDRLSCGFDLEGFEHRAFYDPVEERIEMHLLSLRSQSILLGGETIHFREGETIRTEYSHKYRSDGFEEMVGQAGFKVDANWRDEQNYFSVQYLKAI